MFRSMVITSVYLGSRTSKTWITLSSKSMEKTVDDLAVQYSKIISSVRRTGLLWAIDFANEALGVGFIIKMLSRGVLIVAS